MKLRISLLLLLVSIMCTGCAQLSGMNSFTAMSSGLPTMTEPDLGDE